MTIRTFQAGDDVAQVSIYNEAAAALPYFKPATVDEVRRRCRAADFDPSARLFAVANGRPVGYVMFGPNGRVGFPWCRKGQEAFAEPLFDRALGEMRQRGMPLATSAYRAEWTAQRDFLLAHGFRQAREMINHVLDLVDMPTPAARPSALITPLRPADLPAVARLGAGALRVPEAKLEEHLFRNPYFTPDALFALRSKADDAPVAVGLVVTNANYANPKQLDAGVPCYRLGAFGSEGMGAKRVKGLFSFVAANNRDLTPAALDLLGYATNHLQDTEIETFAAQVPSDAEHLARFYKGLFRRQGSFPVFEREL